MAQGYLNYPTLLYSNLYFHLEMARGCLKSQEGDKVPEHEAQAFSKCPCRATDSGGFQSNGAASFSW